MQLGLSMNVGLFAVAGMEPRASCTVGKCSATGPQPGSIYLFLKMLYRVTVTLEFLETNAAPDEMRCHHSGDQDIPGKVQNCGGQNLTDRDVHAVTASDRS